jgi:hypothetical protein
LKIKRQVTKVLRETRKQAKKPKAKKKKKKKRVDSTLGLQLEVKEWNFSKKMERN